MLASNRPLRWGLLSMILIASLSLWVGNRILHTQASVAISTLSFDERISIEYNSEAEQVEISGWLPSELQQLEAFASSDGAWTDLLPIHINLPERNNDELPAVIGTYTVSRDGSTLVFQPRFGWSAGQSYTAMLDLSVISEITSSAMNTEANMLEWSFLVPASTVPDELPTITTIYPTADEVPENLLRFYIEFSQPMQRGNVYDVVHLLDANGDEVEWPFLRIGQEFWDREMQVLTIILDPGRIKQGVAPNLEAGAPLIDNGRYQLVIGADLTDAYGRPLEDDVTKAFTVVTPDYQSPDPTLWAISTPIAGTHDTLTVTLDGTIDPIMAPQLIRLEDETGQAVATTFSLGDGEQALQLTPVEAWTTGQYRLAVYPTLEDYSGNRIESLFDMAPGTVAELETSTSEREPTYIDFQIEIVD